MRSYLILRNKKCRIYAACGVSQTPMLKEKYKEDYKKQASNVITQLNAICSSGSLTIKDAKGKDNEEEIDKIKLALSSIFSNVDKYNHLNAALYGPEGEIIAQTTEYFGENPIYDYFSEGRSVYEKWKNNRELQTFDVSKSRFDGTSYLPSSYEGEEGVNTVIYPVYVHQEIESVADYNKRQYAIQLNQATDPWHAAVEYMKYVYVFGFLLMAVCMGKTLFATGKAYQKQEELEQTRRDFTNAVAHELKTPLAIMRNLMENMEREQSEEKNSYYRQEAIRQTEVMDQLVQEMILISKLDADQGTKVIAPVSVTEIVEEQLAKLEPQRKEKNIKVELWKEDDFIINGKKYYLEKAIFNLLENAISHNRKDGKIALWIDKDSCRIENTAEPIPKEDMEHLYDMFFTGNKSRNGEKKHNGLGLYLAKGIFDRHGVKIEVKNTDIGVKVEIN